MPEGDRSTDFGAFGADAGVEVLAAQAVTGKAAAPPSLSSSRHLDTHGGRLVPRWRTSPFLVGKRASPTSGFGHLLGTTNDSELERRNDTLAFPSEEQGDPGRCLLDFQLTPTVELDDTGSAGGESCFLAKEQSWRTGSSVRSLLRWTTRSGPAGDYR
jgi:hypothetical protein